MARLRDYLEMIEEYVCTLGLIMRNVESEEDFASKPEAYYSTLHLLQLSIQCLIDSSFRLLSAMAARKPRDYRDLAEVLYEEKVLDDSERKAFSEMIGFRNLLVHVYSKVSPGIVYRIAKDRAERDIKRIAGKIASEATKRGFDP